MGFADFKKQGKMAKAIESFKTAAKKPSYADDRFWKVPKDGAGEGQAIIRFLPQQDVSKSPAIEIFSHGFQEKGKWFIEECPHTIGKKCPICEKSSEIWDSDNKSARKYWRKRQYIANILVVKSETQPEDEGKVFLFKFGKKIYDKIMDAVAPEDDDIEASNVFDFDEGLNFRLKMCQVSGYNNYDKSRFEMKPTAIPEEDQEFFYNQIKPLEEFKDERLFKEYDVLEKKFNDLLGLVIPKQTFEEKKKVIEPTVETNTETETSDNDDEIDFDELLGDDDIPF